MKIPSKDLIKAKPHVIEMLDGSSRVGNAKFVFYPAIKVPGHKAPIALTMTGETTPKPLADYDSALSAAVDGVKMIRDRLNPPNTVLDRQPPLPVRAAGGLLQEESKPPALKPDEDPNGVQS